MKQKFLIPICCLVLLTGCGSSEVSPEQKRNNYDKCVLEFSERTGFNDANSSSWRTKAGIECKNLLD